MWLVDGLDRFRFLVDRRPFKLFFILQRPAVLLGVNDRQREPAVVE